MHSNTANKYILRFFFPPTQSPEQKLLGMQFVFIIRSFKTRTSKSDFSGVKMVIFTSRQINGEKVETVTDFIFLGSKITADSDYLHNIKRCLLLGGKGMTNLDSILQSRDITWLTKVHIVKAMVFSSSQVRCEIWAVKKPEH